MNQRTQYDAPSDPRGKMAADDLADAQVSGYPTVASQYARKDRAGLMLGGSIALLLGAATLFAMSSSRNAVPVPQPTQTPVAVVTPPPLALAPAPVVTPPPPPPAPVAAPPPPVIMPPPPAIVNPNAMLERLRAPALVLDNSPGGAPAAAVAAVAPSAPKQVSREGMSADELFAMRVGDDADSTPARRMTDPSATVAQGTLMTAVLETAINSDLPGFVRAVVSQDVKSFDGRKVLIPRGTKLVGEYKSNLAVGQSRAYILWTRLLRPDGVSIALASPATDFAGANGLSGKVDSHFFKRFGAAILLSVIGAAGQAVGGGNGAIIIAGPQQAMSAEAQRNINIPPTIKVGLGQPIRIFTARDLDFSGLGAP